MTPHDGVDCSPHDQTRGVGLDSREEDVFEDAPGSPPSRRRMCMAQAAELSSLSLSRNRPLHTVVVFVFTVFRVLAHLCVVALSGQRSKSKSHSSRGRWLKKKNKLTRRLLLHPSIQHIIPRLAPELLRLQSSAQENVHER